MKSIAHASGILTKDVKDLTKVEGNLAEVAYKHRERQKKLFKIELSHNRALTIKRVYEDLVSLIDDSTEEQEQTMVRLFKDGTAAECKYIVKALQRQNKTGWATNLPTEALARAVINTPPNRLNDKHANEFSGEVNWFKKLGDMVFNEKVKQLLNQIAQALQECPDPFIVGGQVIKSGD